MLDPTIDEYLAIELPDRRLASDFVPIKPDCAEWGYMRCRDGYKLAVYYPGEGFSVSDDVVPERLLDYISRLDHELVRALERAARKRRAALPWHQRLFGVGGN